MRLTRIRIQKFRAIRECDVRVSSELALVGKNSCGKTSILRALKAFFDYSSEEEAFRKGRHAFLKTTTSEVDLEFDQVPQNCTLVRYGQRDRVRARLKYRNSPKWEVHNGRSWQPAVTDLHDELMKFVRFVFVPLGRDHLAVGLGRSSLLRKAVDSYLGHHTANRDRISPKVLQAAELMKSRAFDSLSKLLDGHFPVHSPLRFEIDYSSTPDYGLLLSDIVLRVTEGQSKVDLEDCGSGTQSLAAFALYTHLATLTGITYILGLEEPEQNLHPQAQRELVTNLKATPLQVVFTTHSTVMLDELKHDEVLLCRRVASRNRSIEVACSQLEPTFWTVNDLDQDKYYQFYRYRNSDIFFSSFVILSESRTDAEIIKGIVRTAGIDLNSNAVSVLNIDGVGSFPYAYHLLKNLGISFAIVVDKDYFLHYRNDQLASSRDTAGFPQYRREFKAGTLLEHFMPDAAERAQLLDLLFSNHSKAMDLLELRNVFCFRWAIEIDIVNSATGRDVFFNHLNVPLTDRTTNELLENRHKSLKRLDNLMPVVTAIPPRNLPHSFLRLRKELPRLIRDAQT